MSTGNHHVLWVDRGMCAGMKVCILARVDDNKGMCTRKVVGRIWKSSEYDLKASLVQCNSIASVVQHPGPEPLRLVQPVRSQRISEPEKHKARSQILKLCHCRICFFQRVVMDNWHSSSDDSCSIHSKSNDSDDSCYRHLQIMTDFNYETVAKWFMLT